MEYKRMFSCFFDAVSNEISIENDVLKRLNRSNFKFTPIRSIKTIELIEKYKINKFLYSLLCLLFILFSPIYFLIKFFKNINFKNIKTEYQLEETLILVANGRIDYLYNKLNKNEKKSYININQQVNNNYIEYKSFLSFFDYIKVYFLSLFSIFYLLVKLKNKTDILQVYVAYDWFLVYIFLSKLRKNVKKIYFANHYDRWAVMFEQLFNNKEVILIQHGILPEDLDLEYKFQNLNKIYCYNRKSKEIFEKIFKTKNTNFDFFEISLKLSEINKNKKTILIIGQPQSIEKEIEIIKQLKDDYKIYIKPHPLFSDEKYKVFKNIEIIKDRNFYPKVDLALCYESTLGLEYESSGVNVLWWKDMNVNNILIKIEEII